ncbi:sensor histidine kinase [Lapillicoccus jejuensis]|uniref:histidine kinase n=1 Tax=Lapillicoccus jejuensis TaxID=402171 RepID=A0A542E2M2_9MICO|nr:HAMP domain-containing sensor histidine kinase [Lapillicoccus jejuensis]TQJ09494.1 signal transduction histidine kinase [Lapillicoccus jejuensis]
MGDLVTIGASTAVACALVAGLGGLALRVVRARSLVLSVVVAALTPLAAVSAAVVVNVRLMFLSAHDSTAVQLALGLAVVIAVGLAVVLGRRVATSSRELASQVRGLGDGAPPGAAGLRTGPSGAPAELAALAAELATTRGRLEEAQRRARALDESRRELVAFMSHDLRTPMAGLRALAEGLEDGVVERATGLRQIRQTVERMNGLVTDLFEVSRLQAGSGGRPRPRRLVSLVELCLDVVGELAAHAERRQVGLRLRSAGDDDRLAVLGDAEELTRALTNLVGNAVRHTGAGGEVVVEAVRRPDGRVAVAVTDGCGGIADEDLARVFDLGWRADPGRSPGDAGAGLGLAIARGVAEAHEGSLDVVNVDGGCRFALVLPTRTS